MATQPMQLPYDLDALEPLVSRETMEVHYREHYRHYVEQVRELAGDSRFEPMGLKEIIMSAAPGPLFNAAAQAWNHELYFRCLTPEGGGRPPRSLDRALEERYGSFDAFKTIFDQHVLELFGCGWVWLAQNDDGHLTVTALKDAGNPLVLGQTPLLVCDVWEHAYYLDHRHGRRAFLDAFWRVLDWRFVEERATEVGALSPGDLRDTAQRC